MSSKEARPSEGERFADESPSEKQECPIEGAGESEASHAVEEGADARAAHGDGPSLKLSALFRGVSAASEDTLRRTKTDEPRGIHVSTRRGEFRPMFARTAKQAAKEAHRKAKQRRHSKRKVAFMRYSYYDPVFRYFSERVLDAEYISLPPATRRTVELGDANSSDFVCTPFKRIVGDYIEALERGADVLVQVTGFCRLTYYGELQEMILRDLGFDDFQMLNFSEVAKKPLKDYVKFCRRVVNPDLSVPVAVKNLFGCYRMVLHLDEFDEYYLANAAFEVEPGSFARERKAYFLAMGAVTTNAQIEEVHKEHFTRLKTLEIDKPANPVRVGLTGDYFTVADAASNMEIESKLIRMGVSVSRCMSITTRNLRYDERALRATISEYVTYDMGPTSSINIAAAKRYAQEGYDGVIHMKAAGCTPEIDVMPVLQRISRDYKAPVLFLMFDSQTSDTGLDTRIEAFYDMISMRKS